MMQYLLDHSTGIATLIGTLLSLLLARLHVRKDLIDRIAKATLPAFWQVEQTVVAGLKAASADGHLTAAEGRMVAAQALAVVKAQVGAGILAWLTAKATGTDVAAQATAQLETHAATLGLPITPNAPPEADQRKGALS